ncbi:MAG: YbhB/YbcL family Raf kinase inhibitor-like protein [Deltaproteobacteria bacterium]|nr:YbhB/YbcL family Raf kinase inhibitor-like protein [Deltaproteobacteria bacterium]
MGFTIKSPRFKEAETIPREYTCEGADVSPELEWANAPQGTKSFSLVVEDPDAPVGTFVHWVIYDMPLADNGLKKAVAKDKVLPDGSKQGSNDFGRTGYNGPCPPRGLGKHRYFFILRALDVATLDMAPGADKKDLEKAMKGHVLGEARSSGVYERR